MNSGACYFAYRDSPQVSSWQGSQPGGLLCLPPLTQVLLAQPLKDLFQEMLRQEKDDNIQKGVEPREGVRGRRRRKGGGCVNLIGILS